MVRGRIDGSLPIVCTVASDQRRRGMQCAREVLAREIGANPSASAPNYSDIPPSPFPPRGSSIGDVEVVERSSSGVAPPSCGGGTQRKNAAAKARKAVAKATAAGKGTTAGVCGEAGTAARGGKGVLAAAAGKATAARARKDVTAGVRGEAGAAARGGKGIPSVHRQIALDPLSRGANEEGPVAGTPPFTGRTTMAATHPPSSAPSFSTGHQSSSAPSFSTAHLSTGSPIFAAGHPSTIFPRFPATPSSTGVPSFPGTFSGSPSSMTPCMNGPHSDSTEW